MGIFFMCVAVFLLLNLGAGLWRLLRGPDTTDQLMAAQLIGTIAVAVFMLLSVVESRVAYLDLALVFALLAMVTAVTFVQHIAADKESPRDTR